MRNQNRASMTALGWSMASCLSLAPARHLRHVEPSVLVAFYLCVEHDSMQGMMSMVDYEKSTTVEHDCKLAGYTVSMKLAAGW